MRNEGCKVSRVFLVVILIAAGLIYPPSQGGCLQVQADVPEVVNLGNEDIVAIQEKLQQAAFTKRYDGNTLCDKQRITISGGRTAMIELQYASKDVRADGQTVTVVNALVQQEGAPEQAVSPETLGNLKARTYRGMITPEMLYLSECSGVAQYEKKEDGTYVLSDDSGVQLTLVEQYLAAEEGITATLGAVSWSPTLSDSGIRNGTVSLQIVDAYGIETGNYQWGENYQIQAVCQENLILEPETGNQSDIASEIENENPSNPTAGSENGNSIGLGTENKNPAGEASRNEALKNESSKNEISKNETSKNGASNGVSSGSGSLISIPISNSQQVKESSTGALLVEITANPNGTPLVSGAISSGSAVGSGTAIMYPPGRVVTDSALQKLKKKPKSKVTVFRTLHGTVWLRVVSIDAKGKKTSLLYQSRNKAAKRKVNLVKVSTNAKTVTLPAKICTKKNSWKVCNMRVNTFKRLKKGTILKVKAKNRSIYQRRIRQLKRAGVPKGVKVRRL